MSEDIVRQLSDVAEYTGDFLTSFAEFAAGVGVFVGIIWLTTWIGAKVRRWLMRRTSRHWAAQPTSAALIDNVLRVGTFAAGLVVALGVVGASTDSLVTWFGVIVAALSLALQDIIKNLVAGFYLLIEQPFKTGDRLVVADHDGYVETVALRVTGLRNARRQLVLVPNYLVFSQVVTNRTALESHCLVLTVADVEGEPADIIRGVADAARSVLGDHGKVPAVEIQAIKPTGTTVHARIWLASYQLERDRAILAIHERYPKSVITVVEG